MQNTFIFLFLVHFSLHFRFIPEDATVVAAAPLSTGLYSVTASRTTGGDLQLDVWSGDYVP